MLLINASQRLSNTTKETIIQKFDARMRKFVQPYQWIGLLVDVNVKGAGLQARAKRKLVSLFIKTIQSDIEKNADAYSLFAQDRLEIHAIQGEIHQFLHNEGDFRDVLCGSDSIAYWRNFGDKVITRMALIVLNTVCHVADCERTWSMHGLIHTKLRNRLSSKSVGSILKLRHWLTVQQEKASDMDVVRKYSQLMMDSEDSISMNVMFGESLETVDEATNDAPLNQQATGSSTRLIAARSAEFTEDEESDLNGVDEGEDAALKQLEEGSEFDLVQRVVSLLADDNDSDVESDETPNYSLGLGLSDRYGDVGDFSLEGWIENHAQNEFGRSMMLFFGY